MCVNDSSAEVFAAGLAELLDVESFARYVALQNLMVNFDDMAGPGRNFLLWYGADDRRFRVIAWDMNLAIGAMPFGPGRSPGARPPGAGMPGMRPPGDGPPRGPMRHGNRLKERFLAAPEFAGLRAQARAELVARWFTSGRAAQLARELAGHIPRVRAGDDERVAAELVKLLADLERLATPTEPKS
jgi:spore coat protein CotH